MSDNHDEKALQVLEKAVYRAQDLLEETKHFQPFLMLLNDTGEIELFENEVERHYGKLCFIGRYIERNVSKKVM